MPIQEKLKALYWLLAESGQSQIEDSFRDEVLARLEGVMADLNMDPFERGEGI